MKKIFIDGNAGTTGLRISERLSKRSDIELIRLKEEHRKDINARKDAINQADIAFLCLPDAAAIESVEAAAESDTVIIDTSTAHRTAEGWAYGFPELSSEKRQCILNSKRIAVPGCHASGFIALVYPLMEKGLIDEKALLTCFSVTGYSGGGKKMIAEYEAPERDFLLKAPRQYGIAQAHKHLPEMVKVTGLNAAPIFSPIVADFYSGMTVTVPIFKGMLNGTAEDIKKIYSEKYTGPIVKYNAAADEAGFISANRLAFKDGMEISVFGNEERILLVARYDNLGKGASGAAIQCMNLKLGADETAGLEL